MYMRMYVYVYVPNMPYNTLTLAELPLLDSSTLFLYFCVHTLYYI